VNWLFSVQLIKRSKYNKNADKQRPSFFSMTSSLQL